jgi:hypothetical protein
MTTPKTNAASFAPATRAIRRPDWPVLLRSYYLRVQRRVLRQEVDDFDWKTYHQFYGPENEIEAQSYTYDLGEVDHAIVDGQIFTVGDAKPLNPWHRVLFEAVINLPGIGSVHEIGTGGGKLLVNLGRLVAPTVRLGGSDIGEGQLRLFRERYPREFEAWKPFVADITAAPLPEASRADVVYTATVLMHIKRDHAYRAALANLLDSAHRYLVLVERWGDHDYVEDLVRAAAARSTRPAPRLYLYDSGAATALIATVKGEALEVGRFQELTTSAQLRKYR